MTGILWAVPLSPLGEQSSCLFSPGFPPQPRPGFCPSFPMFRSFSMLMETIHRKIVSSNNKCFGQVLAPLTMQFQTVWKVLGIVTVLIAQKTTSMSYYYYYYPVKWNEHHPIFQTFSWNFNIWSGNIFFIHWQKAKENFSNITKALQRMNTQSELSVLLSHFPQGVQQCSFRQMWEKHSGEQLQEQKL